MQIMKNLNGFQYGSAYDSQCNRVDQKEKFRYINRASSADNDYIRMDSGPITIPKF